MELSAVNAGGMARDVLGNLFLKQVRNGADTHSTLAELIHHVSGILGRMV